MQTDAPDVLKGVAAGLVGGLVATWVMTRAMQAGQAGLQRLQGPDEDAYRDAQPGWASYEQRDEDRDPENPTEKVAVVASRKVAGKELRGRQREIGGQAVHYGFGTLAGGTYGALCEREARHAFSGDAALRGLGYGSAVFALGDEALVPAFRLAPAPWKQPLSAHGMGLGAHLVYGATLGVVARLVRMLLDALWPTPRAATRWSRLNPFS